MKDIQLMRPHYRPNSKEPEEYTARRTALLYNVENRWDIDNHKQTIRWNAAGHVLKYYSALKSFGCPVDVVSEKKDFSRYPFLVAPAYQLVDQPLIDRLTQYVQAGGRLVLPCRTGQKDCRGQLGEDAWAGPIYNLIGARIIGYDVLPEPLRGKIKTNGKTYEWGVWAEWLEPGRGTSVLARYADQFYAGKVAATSRKLGQGHSDVCRGRLYRRRLGKRLTPSRLSVQKRFAAEFRRPIYC